MGCGSSQSLTVPSGSSDYKYMVQRAWEKVDHTLDNTKKQKIVVNRSGWKTVRIFVSSTFKDFHAEREVLVKEVFPDLRQWCEKRRLHLVDCDLRWGVPKDTTTEETLRMCLGEIDRCYQDNVMPFFLNLTSERCGWIPTSNDISPSLAREYRWIQGLSVTEMEILHGAYRSDNPNSLFMVRNSSFLSSVPPKYESDFLDPNPIACHKLEHLKSMLLQRLGDRVVWYDVEFAGINEDGKVEFSGLQENFSKKVFQFFRDRISEQYPLVDANLDPYQQSKEAHESFLKSRGSVVLGRNGILDEIKQYVEEVGNNKPLILTGGAGTGKSSLTARVADVAETMALNNQIPGGGEEGWLVFYHFVGAVPGSTDLEKCVKRLLKDLNAFNEVTAPKNLESTCQLCCGVLSNPKTRPVIVIVDALNQFDDDKSSSLLSWLPRKLAPQVRVILSMIDETPPHKLLKERSNSPVEIKVTPLDMQAREQMVTEMLGTYNKKLDQNQMVILLSKKSSENPLWLSIACEELRVFGLFNKVTEKITGLKDGLLELLEQVFTRFEEENGGALLKATLCLLETSAHGLLETELLKILGDEDNLMPAKNAENEKESKEKESREKSSKDIGPLSAFKWASVFRALKPFIRPFGDSGEGRLDFYHRALSKAVRKKYFGDSEGASRSDQSWWHKKLADYFCEVNVIHRKVEELPTHLLALSDAKRLKEFLTTWAVFDILFNEDYSTLLLKYWREGFGKEWQDVLKSEYTKCLEQLDTMEAEGLVMKEEISLRYEKVARVLAQSGKHMDALNLLNRTMTLEENELGARPERMVEILALVSTIYDEKLKLYEYVEESQKTELRPSLEFTRKSIAIRESLEGEIHKYKLGRSYIQLAFNLGSWVEVGGDNSLSTEEAETEAKDTVEKAVALFTELEADGYLADALMTKGVIQERGSNDQLEYYKQALEMCLQAYGENSVLTTRLYLNIGICQEDRRDYQSAYDWFVKWQGVCEEVFGYHHPRTARCRSCLAEGVYVSIKKKRDRDAAMNARNENKDLERREVFGYYHPRTEKSRKCLAEARYVSIKQRIDREAAKNARNENKDLERRDLIENDDE